MSESNKDVRKQYASEMGDPELPNPISGFENFGHVELEKLPNTRDLGGMPAADGKRIRSNRLIRSGDLHAASKEDIAKLVDELGLKAVVDFRTPMEREAAPDPLEKMPSVAFHDYPALANDALGITHGGDLKQELMAFKQYAGTPHKMVLGLYPQIVLAPAGIKAYSSFLHILLENKSGAALWHCTEGKDRAGMGALIVERALGVAEADAHADYLATNLFVRNFAERLLDKLDDHGMLEHLDAEVDSMFYAFDDYYRSAIDAIEKEYGSFDAYLEKGLDFGPDKQAALRAEYLE